MDFIFGTLATDELKVVHHRAERRGIQHGHDLKPRDPKPGEAVTLTVRIGQDLTVDQVVCYFTLDGSIPQGRHGSAIQGQAITLEPVDIQWDTLIWGYVSIWQGVLPAQPEGTVVRYKIGAWADGRDETFADWPDVTLTAENAASAFFKGEERDPYFRPGHPAEGTLFTYHVDTLRPPEWAKNAVIYHVFVDRFCPGNGGTWQQTEDLMGFCGGTLWGVREKLDYIADLGADCIWLSPTWTSPSHHGYDATSYDHVEARLGGDEALHALVESAHERGIRVLLDLVCNHISNEHPIFVSALTDPHSPYRDWFHFDESELGYRAFFGARTMPQLKLSKS